MLLFVAHPPTTARDRANDRDPAESGVVFAAVLNAEAGTYPVPSDARTLDASLRAADLCWRRFPYLAERYGDRGLRFARSDSAWLATLTGLDAPAMAEQVTWLRSVLATRGVPSVVLQTQLEILCDELGAALPAGRADHARLREAAGSLGAARQAHVSDAEAAALADEFDAAVGMAWRTRLPDTPLLLGASVADDIDGCPGAAANLAGWLMDPQRFPAAWCAAVQRALDRAWVAAGAMLPKVGQ